MSKNLRVLVVMHIYYTDQLNLLVDCLKNIPYDYDLYVTSDDKNQDLISKTISQQKPDFNFISVENVGYDIWPFIKVITDIDLSKYDYLIKLHTKRDMKPEDLGVNGLVNLGNGYFINNGSTWRDNLLDFISTKQNLQKCLDALQNPQIGMCTRYNLIHNKPNIGGIMDDAKKLYPQYIFELDDFNFVAGTMFISKMKPIQLIKDMDIKIDLFGVSTPDHKTQFAHVVERTIGAAVYKCGMKIVDPFTSIKHKKHVNMLYKKLKIQKTLINIIACCIPVAKWRRQVRSYLLNSNFYMNKLKNIVNTDNNY